MNLTPSEESDMHFAVGNLLHLARQMPCRDAAKMLHGLLVVCEEGALPELRALHRSLMDCDAQLELLAANPRRKAA